MTRGRPLVCAHRGASLELPDNTLEAFAAAVASGCEYIETDVRLRADGTLVLAHDPWHIVDGVAELAGLLELADGRCGLDLEIVERGLERALLDAVDGFRGEVIVTSVYPDVLEEVRRLTRHIATGLVVEDLTGGPDGHGAFALADACGADVTVIEDPLATPAVLALAATDGRPLWVYTINEAPRLTELLGTPGVAGIVTDDPALACGLRDRLPAARS